MKYFIDTEFLEDGRTIDLISIGIAAEDGRIYYAEFADFDWSRATPWLMQNVHPHLSSTQGDSSCTFTRHKIKNDILKFVWESNPEFWAWYADYDWVALCQLYGRMIDLPKGWPMFCRDLRQYIDDIHATELPPQTGTQHNALADAIWVRDAYKHVRRL